MLLCDRMTKLATECSNWYKGSALNISFYCSDGYGRVDCDRDSTTSVREFIVRSDS